MLYTQKVIDNHYNIYKEDTELPVGLISRLDGDSYTVSIYEKEKLSLEDLEWVCEELRYLHSKLKKEV